MKSSKQRRAEIRQRRLERARRFSRKANRWVPWAPGPAYDPFGQPLTGAVPADHAQLAHNNTYGPLPAYYVDTAFTCRDCGRDDLWTAKQQKWWYEIAKGDINTRAVHCRPCRRKRQAARAAARYMHVAGLVSKLGLELAADQLKMSEEEVRKIIASGRQESGSGSG